MLLVESGLLYEQEKVCLNLEEEMPFCIRSVVDGHCAVLSLVEYISSIIAYHTTKDSLASISESG